MDSSEMLIVIVTIYIVSFPTTSSRILLYNTENDQLVEKFDCIYVTDNIGKEIPYCQRPDGSYALIRNQTHCENDGQKRSFRDLLREDIEPNEVLKWSSSTEMADLYASIYYNQSVIKENDNQFLCQCTKPGTFGKYCEYQLTHYATKFSDAIKAQFHQKEIGDPWDTQRYGAILCYKTLPCESSPLCLDWREICDGIQRCSNGTDEENCDKLEFNECEDDEFRCTNGMCISEDFWLDGDFDCMDWSDEYTFDLGKSCPVNPNTINCDEHLCLTAHYSCGDGECIRWETRMAFQREYPALKDCFNKRNLNYMCETSPRQPTWTLENGLCWPDKGYDDLRYPPWNMIHVSNLTLSQKCEYLFRCILSKGFEHDCPCNARNCTQILVNSCLYPNDLLVYPPPGLINSNILIIHTNRQSMEKPTFDSFLLYGNLKCRGFFFHAGGDAFNEGYVIELITAPILNHLLCKIMDPQNIYRDYLSPHQTNKKCWNDSLTFNGRPYAVNPDICISTGECISQYRINDGHPDCYSVEDESTAVTKNYCTGNVGQQRFQCFNDQHKCLPLRGLGTGNNDCSNSYDESWFGTGTDLRQQVTCFPREVGDCDHVKAYIQQSSVRNSKNSSSSVNYQEQLSANRMSFRDHCDSFWNMDHYIDEIPSLCQFWICRTDEYQCRTGQCIPLNWVCDGEWDCSDASDEEAFVLIEKSSDHNARLPTFSSKLAACRKKYSRSPFSNICNTTFQFGCYLSGVSNPLDIQSNRPCINLTQIGDGKEDCYNAYDEKNIFSLNSRMGGGMWGLHLNCEDVHIAYTDACEKPRNCNRILCSRYRDKNGLCNEAKDFVCLENDHCKKNSRCNGKFDCLNGEDEYWCPADFVTDLTYRFGKVRIKREIDRTDPRIQYPRNDMLKVNQYQLSKSLTNPQYDDSFKVHSFQCNRGIAVVHMNAMRCLCPPAYYGDRCELFSDRISIIARIDQKIALKTIPDGIFQIKANLLFNKRIIDHHEFYVVSVVEMICVTFLIILAARSRAKTIGHKMNLGQVLKKQFKTQKELYITPTIIVLSAIPQSILTFSFSCKPLSDWQRHTLLGAYLFSYGPSVLGFILYVLPSTSYKKEFSETLLGKKYFKWILNNNKTQVLVPKTKTSTLI
ncbi:unnamed protein product [Adineta steineri]|uniref:EGF-like domain-containing protein n=1 Tax=Adineta steineri TaxID=433720 RepID=A0A814RV41_9BILA|nr:unnamed protein product [Adineta steineri]CAF1202869.1 unnamed protein product [Adineta steineri]CAF1434810.1 unnamed protein product [Adineta steineri]CAF4099879.1 unnamed protein product [Adineta steineri]